MNELATAGAEITPPLWIPQLLDKPSAWWGHVPFAFWIVAACRPRTLVELGTDRGVSYAACCEAAAKSSLATRCYAVDSWKGDPHAGFYGDEVFDEFRAFHNQNYASFSELIRSEFDAAKDSFRDETIDLLHIDGFHTYEAVKHDFETWRPKLSSRGVVLLHDTNVRRDGFGVWQLLEELSGSYSCFEFLHSYGLGVVAIGSDAPEPVRRLCGLTHHADIAAIRQRFADAGSVWVRVNQAHLESQKQVTLVRDRERLDAVREASLTALAAERDRLRQELDAARAETTRRIADAEQSARQIETTRAEIANEKARSAEEIARLRAALDARAANVNELERRLDEIAQSLAWRFADGLVHAPRAVGRAVRRPFKNANPAANGAPSKLIQSGPPKDQTLRPEAQRHLPVPTLFDAAYYLERYPDVAADAAGAYRHFVGDGWREGRNPNEYFDVSWYLDQNPDVRAAGIDPLRHYTEQGWKEGRDPGPKFSVAAYLERYSDVRESGFEPLSHYIRFGQSEGRLVREFYGDWIAEYDALDDKIRGLMIKRIVGFPLRPLLSVVVPVYNTDLRWLREAIDSVRTQIYSNWQLCLSDDASTLPGVKELLLEYSEKDERIRINFRTTNGHISANSNSALSIATGDFVVLLDADDILPEDALFWVAEEINNFPSVDMIYSDEDKIDAEGRRFGPYFKPDWNPALMLSQNAFSHLGVYRRSLVEKVGRFRIGFEGSQDHDLALRCADETEPSRIRHIPHILYHWRALPESTASSFDAKPYAWRAGARAIEDHLERIGVKGNVTRALSSFYQVKYEYPDKWPKVSIVIPTTGKIDLLRPCLTEILGRTTYPNYEVLLVINERSIFVHEQKKCLDEFVCDPRVRIVSYANRPFNYSWVNNFAVEQADGELICFLNDDIKIITSEWLEQLVVRLQLQHVGAVGVMLYYPDETIQHAGVILGIHGVAHHAFNGLKRGSAGYFGRAGVEQDLSCVTAACLAVRREAFEEVGGLDEDFAVAFNDVDFCIRLRQKGWRIIWTPDVEHYHLESRSLGRHDSGGRAPVFQKEVQMMRERWGAILDSDPCYNPNLSLMSESMDLAFPPRALKWTAAYAWDIKALKQTKDDSAAGGVPNG